MNAVWSDLAFALRTLRKTPAFTVVAIASLALGIGANTAIFTVVDQVLLRLLPVKDPQRLVLLSMKGVFPGSSRGDDVLSYPMYADFAANNSVFSGMFCRFPVPVNLGFSGQTERIAAELVSGTYFPVLGVEPAAGRLLTPADDRIINGHPVVVLSNAFWRSRFAAKAEVVGKEIVLNGHKMTVIGVAQRGFDGVELGYSAQVFIPMMMKAQMTPPWDDMQNRRSRWVYAFGRLKPGVSREQAQVALQTMLRGQLEMEETEQGFSDVGTYERAQYLKNTIGLLPASRSHSDLRTRMQSPLWALLSITAAVLLIACANVANLLLARSAARQREIAIRLSLGAARARVISQLLIESLVLAAAGGSSGLLIASWLDGMLAGFLPPEKISLQLSTHPDTRVLLFTIAVSLLTAILFGLIPALQATKPDIAPTLKSEVSTVIGGGVQLNFRKALVTAQVTLSLLLLIGAGLFIRSLHNLRGLGPGFKAPDV
ncbi:MAG: ABC transporter permease, partial [Acidobacteriaceae bacterium]|nr:ABC transporter permease [Acidobacteriaceae bacterium]